MVVKRRSVSKKRKTVSKRKTNSKRKPVKRSVSKRKTNSKRKVVKRSVSKRKTNSKRKVVKRSVLKRKIKRGGEILLGIQPALVQIEDVLKTNPKTGEKYNMWEIMNLIDYWWTDYKSNKDKIEGREKFIRENYRYFKNSKNDKDGIIIGPFVDLKEVYLGKAKLNDVHLQHANLFRTVLTETDLNRADLTDAILTGAGLYKANLKNAFLNRANLKKAYLEEANLTGANLSSADLTGANLKNTDLTDVVLTGADLTGAVLTDAKITKENISFKIKDIIYTLNKFENGIFYFEPNKPLDSRLKSKFVKGKIEVKYGEGNEIIYLCKKVDPNSNSNSKCKEGKKSGSTNSLISRINTKQLSKNKLNKMELSENTYVFPILNSSWTNTINKKPYEKDGYNFYLVVEFSEEKKLFVSQTYVKVLSIVAKKVEPQNQ